MIERRNKPATDCREKEEQVEEWVDACQRGQNLEGSFRLLFEHHHRLLLAFFHRRGFRGAQVEDLCQETFLRAYRGLPDFRREVSFRSWLFQLAINVFRQQLRSQGAKKRAGREVSLNDDGSLDNGEDRRGFLAQIRQEEGAQDRLLGRERLRLVRSSLDELPPKMRHCAMLRWYHDYDYRQIARLLDTSPQAARVQVFKARQRVLRALAGLDQSAAPQTSQKRAAQVAGRNGSGPAAMGGKES